MEQIDPDARYSDPDLTPVDHPGALHEAARTTVRRLLRDLVDDAAVDRWLGTYLTRPSRDRQAVPPETPVSAEALADALRRGVDLRRGPVSHLAFIEHDDGTATLFVNGEATTLDAALAHAAPLLTGRTVIPADTLTPHLDDDAFVDLVASLVNDGVLELDEA
jgi:50S ribosomal protein L16 3-hydroxylase